MVRTRMKLERVSKRLVWTGRIFSLLPKCTSNAWTPADISWSTFHDRVEEGLDATLTSLKTDYLDLYLVHWPMYVPTPIGTNDNIANITAD
jgi:aryl-alcohol dehydrogenase-like predicted oxidoreductase